MRGTTAILALGAPLPASTQPSSPYSNAHLATRAWSKERLRLIAWGVALEVALLLIGYTPWGNAVFGTAAPPASVWLCIMPFALAMILLEEAREWYARRQLVRSPAPNR